MRNFGKLVLITLPLAALGAGFLAYTVSNIEPPEQHELAERVTHVSVVAAEVRSVRPVVTGFGRVEPARTFAAIAQVAGTAEYVNPSLHRGEILPEGSVLLRLSDTDFKLAIAQSRTAIRTAEARLKELEIASQNYMASLAIEQRTLELREQDLSRAESLYGAGSIPQTSRDAALTAVLAQRQKVQGLESSIALLPTQRAAQSEQIEASRISLALAELNLSRTELVLPYDARVSSVSVETGEFVRAGNQVAELDGVEAAEVEAQVNIAGLREFLRLIAPEELSVPMNPVAMTQKIRELDLEVAVRLDLGEEFISWDAAIDRLSDKIDPKTGAVGVIVRVDDAYRSIDPGIRPPLTQGMFVEVVLTGPPLDGFVLPRTALRDGAIFVADADKRLRRVDVVPQLVQGDIVVISQGLEPGTPVLAVPPRPAIDGMLLELHFDDEMTQLLATGGSDE